VIDDGGAAVRNSGKKMEDRKGMIKEGYPGDVVIFDNGLLSVPPGKNMTSNVDYTIVGGRVVYSGEGAQ